MDTMIDAYWVNSCTLACNGKRNHSESQCMGKSVASTMFGRAAEVSIATFLLQNVVSIYIIVVSISGPAIIII